MKNNGQNERQSGSKRHGFSIGALVLTTLLYSELITANAIAKGDAASTNIKPLMGAWQCHSKLSDGIYLEINTTDAFMDNGLYVSVGSMVMMPTQGFTTLDYTVTQYFTWKDTKDGILLTVSHSDIKNLSGSGHDNIFPIQTLFYETGDSFVLPVSWQGDELILQKFNGKLPSICTEIQP